MRLFIAIELTDDVRRELGIVQEKLKASGADVKWVAPENIHLTLKFLGNVDDKKAGEVKKALDRAARGFKPFNSTLFKLGAFPKPEYPRVIWAGIDQNSSLIKEMASKIEDECSRLGFSKEERAFSAHLTIGRVRSPKNKAALKSALIDTTLKAIPFKVDRIILFQSKLTPKGPIYTEEHSAPLTRG